MYFARPLSCGDSSAPHSVKGVPHDGDQQIQQHNSLQKDVGDECESDEYRRPVRQ